METTGPELAKEITEPELEIEITEAELDALLERELTQAELMNLVLGDKADYTNHEELVLNYKKLVKHASYYYGYQKKQNIKAVHKNERIKSLEASLEKKNSSSTVEASNNIEELDDEEIEPFFADYLRDGYKIRMGVGSITAEDKEGNKKVIANIDGNDWRDNPPTRVNEVIGKNLIVAVTEEYEDGSVIEIDRYTIAP